MRQPRDTQRSIPHDSLLFQGGRGVRVTRTLVLVVVVVLQATKSPVVGLSGRHLLVLVTLTLSALAEAERLLPDSERKIPFVVGLFVEAAAAGIMVGFSAGTGTALLGFSAFDAAVAVPAFVGISVGLVGVAATFVGVVAAGSGDGSFALALIPGIAMLIGLNRRQYALRVQDSQQRLADAERIREEQARSARLAERADMAREIHDVLAHSLGALVLQLDAAGAVLAADPPDAARAARIVADARNLAHRGLQEARQAVGTLRTDRVPLDQSLRSLIDGPAAAVGLAEVVLTLAGTPRALREDANLTAYRTVQEGLTNARKHAPGSRVSVALVYEPDATVVTVRNNLGDPSSTGEPPATASGAAPRGVGVLAESGGGHGLEGLRERAALVGGTLRAGPSAGGWTIELRIPVAVAP